MKNFNHQIQLITILFSLLSIDQLFGQEEIPNTKFGLGVTLFNINEYTINRDGGSIIHLTIDLSHKLRFEPTIGFVFSEGEKGIHLLFPLSSIGGEYYFIKNFSIGSEVQLNGMINGSSWLVFTNTAVTIRFYFKN